MVILKTSIGITTGIIESLYSVLLCTQPLHFFQMIENTDASQEVIHPKELDSCSLKMLAVAKVEKDK